MAPYILLASFTDQGIRKINGRTPSTAKSQSFLWPKCYS